MIISTFTLLVWLVIIKHENLSSLVQYPRQIIQFASMHVHVLFDASKIKLQMLYLCWVYNR